MDRPRRKISRINYRNFNEKGTSEIDISSFQSSFQKIADSGPEIQLYASENDLDLLSEDEANKLNEAAAIVYTPTKVKDVGTSESESKRIVVNGAFNASGVDATEQKTTVSVC